MNDLLQQLEAAIAETERIALAAGAQSWATGSLDWTEETGWVFREEECSVVRVVEDPDMAIVHAYDVVRADRGYRTPTIEQAAHIAHNDPKRVLRRVARDRKLLARHKPVEMAYGNIRCYQCREDHTEFGEYDNVSQPVRWPCDDVRDLAEDYEIEVES